MRISAGKTDIATFSPELTAGDDTAAYWMRQVTFRLRREVCWCWHERGLAPRSQSAELPPGIDKASASLSMSRYYDQKIVFFRTDPTARYLSEQLDACPPSGGENVRGGFGWVASSLGLDRTSTFLLALGLTVAFDNAAGNVIALCLNDCTMTCPNLALAQRLWDEPEEILRLADPAHPVFRYGLLHNARAGQESAVIDWESPLAVPAIVARNLLFPDSALPEALAVVADGSAGGQPEREVRLAASRLCCGTGRGIRVMPIRGRAGCAHAEVVGQIAEQGRRKVVAFKGSPSTLLAADYFSALATLCWLKDTDLFLDRDAVSALCRGRSVGDPRVLPLPALPITVYMAITDRSEVAGLPDSLLLPVVDVPGFSYDERRAHWKAALGPKGRGLDDAVSECSRRFRYEKQTIDSIAGALRMLPQSLTRNDLTAACRAEVELDLGDLAQKVTPRFENEELILPAKQRLQFQEIVRAMMSLTEVHYGWGTAKAWNESGISVLFAGPPGTGKTMAAEILATELDLPMYRIDLSQVVNKYIGETEKNLKRLFDSADTSDLILFFDEADALFGRRTEVRDAHDRYANLEVSYLLERMERFKGLAILATNHKKDLDSAFMRRLRYVLDFPLPGVGQRRRIFRQVVPPGVDVSEIDFDFLARQFPLAGGHIRSIVFNACLQSAGDASCADDFRGKLAMEQVIIAVRREYDKVDQPLSLEQFGLYANIIERMEKEDANH